MPRILHISSIFGLSTLTCACGAGEAAVSAAPMTVSSYVSSNSPSSPSVSGSFGATSVSSLGIVVAPSQIEVPFELATSSALCREREARQCSDLTALKDAAEALRADLGQQTRRPVTARMQSVRVETSSEKKAQHDDSWTVATGCFVVDLAADTDFWARSSVLVALQSFARERAARTPTQRTTLGAPIPHVADREAYRAKLTEQWIAQSQTFAQAADPGTATLRLTECAAPFEIREETIGSDQLRLTLVTTCKLATGAPQR